MPAGHIEGEGKKMKLYTIYVGLNDKDSKKQETETGAAVAIVAEILYKYVDGATISEARGIYTHDDGIKIIEKTIRAEVLDFDGSAGEAIRAAALEIKKALNQESIALQAQEIESELI